jgi:hypothetical protein
MFDMIHKTVKPRICLIQEEVIPNVRYEIRKAKTTGNVKKNSSGIQREYAADDYKVNYPLHAHQSSVRYIMYTQLYRSSR